MEKWWDSTSRSSPLEFVVGCLLLFLLLVLHGGSHLLLCRSSSCLLLSLAALHGSGGSSIRQQLCRSILCRGAIAGRARQWGRSGVPHAVRQAGKQLGGAGRRQSNAHLLPRFDGTQHHR